MDRTTEDPAAGRAFRQRFPRPDAFGASYQCAVILLTNAYLLYLVVIGQSSPVALVAFNVCELVMLGVIARITLLAVPAQSRVPDPDQGHIVQRLFGLAFALLWLFGIYSFGLIADTTHSRDAFDVHHPIDTLARLNVLRPLLLSGIAAVVAAIGDWSLWHRRGGLFVPQMALSSAPKILTLALAPMPAAVAGVVLVESLPEIAPVAWSGVYLLVKTAAELGVLAWQYYGMPGMDAADKGEAK